MEERVTWRTLLSKMTHASQERQRLAQALGVNPITLSRWANNISQPRRETLRALPVALPAVGQQLITLIEQEYPDLFLNQQVKEQQAHEIPATFYARFFRDYTFIPENLRESSLCQLVLQQLIAQLDPRQTGIGIFIVQCVPPSSGNTVRSLLKTMGRGTAHWEDILQHQTQFFGAESQVGDALYRGHMLLTQNHEEKARLYPRQYVAGVENTVVFPLLLADQTAGCLCAFSLQPAYFSPTWLHLLQDYVNLLMVAFEPGQFYPLQNIELGVMPPLEEQRRHLSTFQSRVLDHLKEATRRGHLLTGAQAERLVWQELEHLLLFQSHINIS